MTTNPYFRNFDCKGEQDLYEKLILELIQAYGMDVIYLPRTLVKEDLIFGEDVLSKFEDSFQIEVYLENVEGWEGQGDFMSKFGLEIRDSASLIMPITRFKEELIKKDLFDANTFSRPREGDLLWFPLTKHLLEIKFVEHEDVFYQNGKLKTYNIKVEKFEYSHEDLNTGIADVDIVEDEQSYTILLNLGSGTGTYTKHETVYQGVDLLNATASAEIVSHDTTANTAIIKNISGSFNLTDQLIGDTSASSYIISTLDDQNDLSDKLDNTQQIEFEADSIVDFTENNPFGDENF